MLYNKETGELIKAYWILRAMPAPFTRSVGMAKGKGMKA